MEEGERKIAEKAKMAEALSFKVRSTDSVAAKAYWHSRCDRHGLTKGVQSLCHHRAKWWCIAVAAPWHTGHCGSALCPMG